MLLVQNGAERGEETVPAVIQEKEHKPDCADLLVAYLEQIGAEYIFGVPGGAIEPLYNALARRARQGGKVRPVLARHEAGAAFMADGYARETGKIGVCCATSGPGATNLITGVSCAYDNNVPMLVITGQPALPAFGRNAFQESACTGVNVLEMFRHCTRYNSLVSHVNQFELKLVTALQRTTRSPRGPSHLSIPIDIFRSVVSNVKPSYDLRRLLAPTSLVDEGAVQALFAKLQQARDVVLLIGGGCGEAIGAIMRFARERGYRFVATPDGKGLVNPRHPLFRGVFGFGGHASAEVALRDESIDLIVAIGVDMGEWNSGSWSDSLLNERLVHIDESDENLSRTPMACLHLHGSILGTVNRILEGDGDSLELSKSQMRQIAHGVRGESNPEEMFNDPDKCRSDAVPVKPQRLMHELGKMFPPTTRFLADTGNSVAWAVHYLQPLVDRRMGERRQPGGDRTRYAGRRKTTGGWLRVTMNFAPMGWAIGGAVGTAAGNSDSPVVCITGDGSMLMNGQEISVAVAERLTVVFVVLNDSALGMVKHGQKLAGAEQIGCDLPRTDFAAMAKAMGAHAHTIRSPRDLVALDMAAICARKGPTLLDVVIDPREISPMDVRIRALTKSF